MPDTSVDLCWLEQSRDRGDPALVLENMPYARALGLEVNEDERGRLFVLPPRRTNLGNPLLPAIHGGVMAAFMESAAIIDLMLSLGSPRMPAIINFSIDYLRAGRLEPVYARCELVREGRRLANVRVCAWQKDEQHPVATARMHIMLAALDGMSSTSADRSA
ncbi:PaaI family thioesterase [Larsenimonas rhizosphaerae]|uniref:PaaI family thioesterase n=1 Tax=Larsenimonas rhizosphaerae TaxID=2944682 RepID=A0AA42CTP0_9GAMM|nr:PaaI family thioesterase [Larsenimonas rhizosphaerae]MCM2130562.1 PaaI family thioesterase [Larsenimonas rhizosphaerae]MCX2523266.1 PaaI family thioesterase [Larsenimonas rhizosphaerae]